eukprot:5040748-Lingulodinium_polyedra.AAC.1
MGPDMLCAISWCKANRVNVTEILDWSHGCKNDDISTVKEMGLWDWQLLMLVLFNVDENPFGSDERWHQVESAWSHCKENYTQRDCVLFSAYAADMVQEQSLEYPLTGDEQLDPEAAMWNRMVADGFRNKGHQTNTARYLAPRKKGADFLPFWSMKRCKYEYTGIEIGCLSGKKWLQLKVPDTAAIASAKGKEPSTSSSGAQCTERALRNACSNGLE